MGKLVLLIYLYRQPETESTAGIRKGAPQQEEVKEKEDVENAVEAYGHKNCRLSDLIISDYILI